MAKRGIVLDIKATILHIEPAKKPESQYDFILERYSSKKRKMGVRLRKYTIQMLGILKKYFSLYIFSTMGKNLTIELT